MSNGTAVKSEKIDNDVLYHFEIWKVDAEEKKKRR
jgi:hypothetical protein